MCQARARIPDGLYDELKEAAAKEKRSIARQVEFYIEEGLKRDGYKIEKGAENTDRSEDKSGAKMSDNQLRGG
jgi:hypothetical protein